MTAFPASVRAHYAQAARSSSKRVQLELQRVRKLGIPDGPPRPTGAVNLGRIWAWRATSAPARTASWRFRT